MKFHPGDDVAQNHVRCDDCTFAKTPAERYLHFADAVIRELGLPPTWGKPSFDNGRADD